MSARADRIVRLEPQTCGRRMTEPGPWERAEQLDCWERGTWAATHEEADAEVAEFMAAYPRGGIGNVFWNYGGEQPRTCSFCGGIHPDDAIALIKAGWTVDATTKSYKRYLEPPGYRDYMERIRRAGYNVEAAGEPRVASPVPPVKLYTQHFSPEQIAAFNQVMRAPGPTGYVGEDGG
jgi:hypothetical protein